MIEKKLKLDLVLQSFAPLFLILCVKHAHCYWHYLIPFISRVRAKDWMVFSDIVHHAFFGDLIVFILSLLWLLWAVMVYCGFAGTLRNKFDTRGEKVIIITERRDVGATFLASFVLPLLFDDVGTLNGFIVFGLLLIMMVILLVKSNLFYQNPVLTILGYRVFEFQFVNPYIDIEKENKTYIGITKGKMITEKATIRRKPIADDVFIIFNE